MIHPALTNVRQPIPAGGTTIVAQASIRFRPRRFRMHPETYARLKMQGDVLERQLRQGRIYIPREHRNRRY